MSATRSRPSSTRTRTRNATPPPPGAPLPPPPGTPPPRTIGQLRALLSAALAIVERKGALSRGARRDLAALLYAALRYKRPASERGGGR